MKIRTMEAQSILAQSLLKFEPIPKQRIWGGDKLSQDYDKPFQGLCIGESWEISAVENSSSVVQNSVFKGCSIDYLVRNYKEAIVGQKNYTRFGDQFPLLIKFIDANRDLSVQLHPDDAIAKRKHNTFGKSEMWYVVDATPGAKIVVGFNREMDRERYERHVADKTISEVLHQESVSKGDAFYVYPGLIHAIGAGVVIAEIQQTSDVTYRIYDYDRKDSEGNYRELHQQDALEAIDFDAFRPARIQYNAPPNTITNLVSCSHFVSHVVEVVGTLEVLHSALDSFVIYICVAGKVRLRCADGEEEVLCAGGTILVPAVVRSVSMVAVQATVLQVYI